MSRTAGHKGHIDSTGHSGETQLLLCSHICSTRVPPSGIIIIRAATPAMVLIIHLFVKKITSHHHPFSALKKKGKKHRKRLISTICTIDLFGVGRCFTLIACPVPRTCFEVRGLSAGIPPQLLECAQKRRGDSGGDFDLGLSSGGGPLPRSTSQKVKDKDIFLFSKNVSCSHQPRHQLPVYWRKGR